MENSVSKHSLPAVLEYCGPTIAWKTIPRGHRTTNHVPRILMYWKEATYSLGECCRMLWHMFGEQRVWGIQPFRMLFWNHARGNSIVFTGFPAFCFTARQKNNNSNDDNNHNDNKNNFNNHHHRENLAPTRNFLKKKTATIPSSPVGNFTLASELGSTEMYSKTMPPWPCHAVQSCPFWEQRGIRYKDGKVNEKER